MIITYLDPQDSSLEFRVYRVPSPKPHCLKPKALPHVKRGETAKSQPPREVCQLSD